MYFDMHLDAEACFMLQRSCCDAASHDGHVEPCQSPLIHVHLVA